MCVCLSLSAHIYTHISTVERGELSPLLSTHTGPTQLQYGSLLRILLSASMYVGDVLEKGSEKSTQCAKNDCP